MELANELKLPVPIEDAWAALTDLERVASCMPGAQLLEVDGDDYRGIVKVRVGAISAQYKGTARLVESNEDDHRAVLQATGRDTRGQGNAAARVTAVLSPHDAGTIISLTTDLTISGKVAQFGRSVLSDVSSKLLGQFANNLEMDLRSLPTEVKITETAPGEDAGDTAGGARGSRHPSPGMHHSGARTKLALPG